MGAATRIAGKEACEALADFINDYGADVEGFMAELNRTHRTCQQGIGRLVVAMLKKWKSDHEARRFDARNEAVCKLAEKMLLFVSDDDLYLPLI